MRVLCLPWTDMSDTDVPARYGAPTLEDYRRAYAGFGADWPGDEEIRRRHIVAPDTAA